MKNRQYFAMGIMGFIILAFLIYSYLNPPLNWNENYHTNNKQGQPYDVDLLYQIMPSYVPEDGFKTIEKDNDTRLPNLDSIKLSNTNYFFIGNRLYMDSSDISQLMNYVAHGNNAFIITKSLPSALVDTLFQGHCFIWQNDVHLSTTDTTVQLNFYHENLFRDSGYAFNYVQYNQLNADNWDYLNTESLCEQYDAIIPLGEVQGYINFYKKSYGKGYFIFNTTPLAFTNYQLVHNKDAKPYVEGVFSHLLPDAIYWDNKSKTRPPISRTRNDHSDLSTSKSPLAYILNQTSLKWAWYTLIGMAIVFFVFGSRRKQRVVPVLAKNKNTSLDFIHTMGQIHYNVGNHHQLALKQQKHFLTFVQSKFKISTQKLDDTFVDALSEKANLDRETVKKITTYINNIQTSKFISEDALIHFHLLTDQFYKNCK